jgi:hypothetical protein
MKNKLNKSLFLSLTLIIFIQNFAVSQTDYFAFFPFNGNANDESGNNNNGIVYGAELTFDRFDNQNEAYYFDGYNDYISLPVEIFGNQNKLTFSLWVKPESYEGNQWPPFIGSYTNDVSHNICLGLWKNTGHIHFEVDTDEGNFPAEGILQFEWNEWNHIAMVYDGQTLTEYVNGCPGKSISAHGNLLNTELIRFGHYVYNQYFSGSIDDVRIYRNALNSSEIAALYGGFSYPIITSQPINTEVCEQNNASFSVEYIGNVLNFQWQISIDNGNSFTDIVDNQYYLNSNTPELNILNAELSMDLFEFRCKLTNYCDDIFYSDTAILNINYNIIVPDVIELPDIYGICFVEITTFPTANYCGTTILASTSDPLYYDSEGTFLITWKYENELGNFINQTQNVIVTHDQVPEIQCPDNVNIFLNSGEFEYTVRGTEFDLISYSNDCMIDTLYNNYNNLQSLEGEEFACGEYLITWFFSDIYGNTADCSFVVSINNYIIIKELLSKEIKIYPNPTNDMFNISEIENATIIISDLLGRKMLQISNSDKNIQTIDFSDFGNGVYIISIYKKGKVLGYIIEKN